MKCVIIAPLYCGEEKEWLNKEQGDMIIAADAGYDAAVSQGIVPDLVIGDFDSMPVEHCRNVATKILPVKKDDTDMRVCIHEGQKKGYHDFILAGALGGRIDHTISNLQCAYEGVINGDSVWLCDRQNRVTVLLPGNYRIQKIPGRKLSVLAWSDIVENVELTGTEWELHGATLTNTYPIGCSNEFASETASLSFSSGAVIVAISQDKA